MFEDESNKDNDTPSATTGQAFAARRRIVKGLASSVPVVMTIGCGQALAQASSLQCITRPTGLPEPDECTLAPDEWAREGPVDCEITARLDSGSSLGSGIAGKGSPATRSFDLNLDSASSTRSGLAGKGSPSASTSDRRLDSSRQVEGYRLIYVDENGNRVANSTLGSPVTLSCYTSFLTTSV